MYLDVNQFPLERPTIQPPCPCLADQLTELHPLDGECIPAALHKALRGRHQISRNPQNSAGGTPNEQEPSLCMMHLQGICVHVHCQLLHDVPLAGDSHVRLAWMGTPVHDCNTGFRRGVC